MPEAKKGSVPKMTNPLEPPTKRKEKVYPSAPDTEGYYYKSKEEEANGILTKDYENSSAVKKVSLSAGQTAIIRKLKGRDMVETKRAIQNDNSLDFETVNMAQAIEIDGKQQNPEYYLDNLFQADYALLLVAFGELNF